ncbi:MAG: tetratricopeptide repeat protein [bacterium]|nr:tetratricopeptide repeat protein [bacterium]
MLIILFPVLAYAVVHVVGRYHPACFWGADQLHYYPMAVTAAFVLTALVGIILSVRADWLRRVDDTLGRLLAPLKRRAPSDLWSKVLLAVLFVLLACLFGDRTHHLGDSAKWFAVLDHALLGTASMQAIPGHHSHLDVQGLEYVNVQQALDLFIHFQLYRVGHVLWQWTSVDAYEWISSLSGGLYAVILWSLAGLPALRTRDRLTLFVFFLALGLTQLFFGYGESYTLVTVATALYVLSSLRALRGEASLFYPTLCLLLSVALHLLSLSLLPSWFYLLWRDRTRLGNWVRKPVVFVPCLILGGVASAVAYAELYRDLHLPLWQTEEAGKYALVSIPHGANLANEILLLSPFGLLWGIVALMRRHESSTQNSFLGVAALGSGALIIAHYISMGGRDWDLMAFPGLFYSMWGIFCLLQMTDSEALLRRVRWSVLPLMVLHTALWLGINNDPARAMERLGNLLQYTPNQALHYQHFVRGHYHLNVRQDSPALAAIHLRQAIAATPDSDVVTLRRYEKYLAQALVMAGDFSGAMNHFDQAFSGQDRPVEVQSDLTFHDLWITALLESGHEDARGGAHGTAEQKWRQAADHAQQIIAIQPSVSLFRQLGRALQVTGQPEAARDAYRKSLALPGSPQERDLTSVYLAQSLQESGRREAAIRILEEAIRPGANQADLHFNLGNLLYTDDQFGSAALNFEIAIQGHGDNPRFYVNAAKTLMALGEVERARQILDRGVEQIPDSAELCHSLGDVARAQGQTDQAMAAYARAAELGSMDVRTYLSLSRLHLDAGDRKNALPLLQHALHADLHGRDDTMLTRIGMDLFELGRIQEAAEAYSGALAMNGQNLDAGNNLGWCLFLQGQLDRAADAFGSVLARGRSPQAQFNLGLVFLTQGRIDQARAVYAQGLEQYGAATAEQIGALRDLRQMVQRGTQVAEASAILQMFP